MVTTFVGGASLIAALTLYRGLRLAAVHHDWDISSTFVFFVGFALNAAAAAATYLSAGATSVDAFGNTYTIYPGWVESLNRDLARLVVAVGLVFFVVQVRRRAPVSTPSLLALMLAVVGLAAEMLHGSPLLTTGHLGIVAVLLATLVLPPGRGAALGAATFGALAAIASGLLTFVNYDAAVVPCDAAGKCGPLGVLFFGAAGNENALALSLCLAIPFAWLAFRGRSRFILTTYLTWMVVATGSRTASVAALVAFGALLLGRPRFGGATTKPRLSIVRAAGVGGLIVGAALPWMGFDPRSFTGRAYLWQVAQDHLSESPIFGLGATAWQHLYSDTGSISKAATYSVHNQILDVIFVGGAIGALLFLALLRTLVRGTTSQRVTMWCVLMPMVYCGLTERTWGVSSVEWLSFGYLAAVLVWRPPGHEERPAREESGTRAAPVALVGH